MSRRAKPPAPKPTLPEPPPDPATAARRAAQELQHYAETLEGAAAEIIAAADHLEDADSNPAETAAQAERRIAAGRHRLHKILDARPMIANFEPIQSALTAAYNLQAAAEAQRAHHSPPIEDTL